MTSIETLINSAFEGLTVQNAVNTEQVATMLDSFGLRWTVAKEKLSLPDKMDTNFYGIVRQDTRYTFATCKAGYRPFQNSELAELLIRVSEKTGYTIHSGGAFDAGAKVFIQLETGNKIKHLGENQTVVNGYITGVNSFDGTSKLKWGVTNLTVCCKNVFSKVARSLNFGARHTESMQIQIDACLRDVEATHKEEIDVFNEFIKWATIPIQPQHLARIVKSVTQVDISGTRKEAQLQSSAQAINKADVLMRSISKETAEKGTTLWGLFSGVTHYTTHKISGPNRYNGRLEGKYVGLAHKLDNTAFAEIKAMAL